MYSKKVLRYYCKYCSKGFWKKPVCLEHEKKCFYNSSNFACGTCRDFEKKRGVCLENDKILHTKADMRINGSDHGRIMPYQKFCKDWKPKQVQKKVS